MCDACLIFVVALKHTFFCLFCYKNKDIQLQDAKCSSQSSESVKGDKLFPSEGDINARVVLLLVEVECCGLGVNSE